MPRSPPLPLGATIAVATAEVIVTFDRPLTPGASDALNWLIKANIGAGAKTYTPAGPGVIAGSTVTLQTVAGGLAFPPLGVTYSATPPDVTSTFGIPAAAFADLPLVNV